MLIIVSCTSPATTASSAGPPPLYGTWTKFVPVSSLKSSTPRWTTLPVPDGGIVQLARVRLRVVDQLLRRFSPGAKDART